MMMMMMFWQWSLGQLSMNIFLNLHLVEQTWASAGGMMEFLLAVLNVTNHQWRPVYQFNIICSMEEKREAVKHNICRLSLLIKRYKLHNSCGISKA